MSAVLTRCLLCAGEPKIGLLCARHAHTLRTWLVDVVEAYALLDFVIEPGSVQTGSDSVKRRRSDEAPPPIRLDVAALRDRRNLAAVRGGDIPSVLGVMASWAGLVREERHLATPATAATVAGEAEVLSVHLDWICAQPWVDELHRELKQLRAPLLAAIGEPPRKPIGNCPVVLIGLAEEAGEVVEWRRTCDGPLYPDRWGAMRVHCASCGEEWGEEFIRRAAEIVDRGA